jgi:hypothetical protein
LEGEEKCWDAGPSEILPVKWERLNRVNFADTSYISLGENAGMLKRGMKFEA